MELIFLPGWGSSSHHSPFFYKNLLDNIKHAKHIHCLFKPHLGTSHAISDLSSMAAQYIEKNIPDQDLIFIGYSMGGIELLDILHRYKNIETRTKTAITIASPIYGADKQNKMLNIVSNYSRSTKDMLPNSQYLWNLHTKINITKPILCISAKNDSFITPQNSKIVGNNNIADIDATHLTILLKSKTVEIVNNFLEQQNLPVEPCISKIFINLSNKYT